MLNELHAGLEQLIHRHGGVPAGDVDVSFDAPRRDWVASLTHPTLDFFLFDVRENLELRRTDLETRRGDRTAVSRMPPRRFDLRYLVSAITADVHDEHLLLWRALNVLMKYSTYPDDVLPEPLRSLAVPLSAQVSRADDEVNLLDVWGGLESPPRPSLLYVVTVPLDLDIELRSPLVLTRRSRYATPGEAEARLQIGGVVCDAGGRRLTGVTVAVRGSAAAPARTDGNGEFTITRVPAGAVTLEVVHAGTDPKAGPKLVTVQVPSDSYEITID